MRQSSTYEEWIARCEETIRSYLAAVDIDPKVLGKLLSSNNPLKERTDLEKDKNKAGIKQPTKEKKDDEESTGKKTSKRMTGLIMGKLHPDMIFLEELSKNPALKCNLLRNNFKKKPSYGGKNAQKTVCDTAKDGLNFLEVRKEFWETSEPAAATERKRQMENHRNKH